MQRWILSLLTNPSCCILQVAKVFISVYGDEKEQEIALEGLKSKAKYVRMGLGKRMSLRMTPEVRFVKDDSLERGSRVRPLSTFVFLSFSPSFPLRNNYDTVSRSFLLAIVQCDRNSFRPSSRFCISGLQYSIWIIHFPGLFGVCVRDSHGYWIEPSCYLFLNLCIMSMKLLLARS